MKLLLILIPLLLTFSQTTKAQFAIIGHEDLSEDELSIQELRDIFSGENGTWENGDKVRFSERKETVSYLMEFYKELGLRRTFFRQNRIKNVQEDPSRLGSMFNSDERILMFVSENLGAIGIVSETAANLFSGSIKIVQIKRLSQDQTSTADK